MKQTILHNWNFMRLIRLGIAVAIIIQGVAAKDTMFSAIGLLLAGLAVFNIGCCGTGTCFSAVKENNEASKEIIFEEVVSENKTSF